MSWLRKFTKICGGIWLKGEDMRMLRLIPIVLCAFLIAGCEQTEASAHKNTLWVLTEQSSSDGMNLQAEIAAERLEEKYGGFTVLMDVLPVDEAEREIRLKQLRAQIMAGEGPDVYLLPTGNTLMLDDDTEVLIEGLFADVNQAIQNGIFAGIQEYYDADQGLDKDELKSEVIDAGLWGDQRYVLPLRYDLPVILTTRDGLETLGLTQETADMGISALARAILGQPSVAAAYGLQMPDDLSLLPSALDYEKGEVLLSAQEIREYMRLYQIWKSESVSQSASIVSRWAEEIREDWLIGGGEKYYESQKKYLDEKISRIDLSFFYNLEEYICYESDWYAAGFPLCTSKLGSVIDAAVLAKAKDQELLMLPLRGTDGKITAAVTYYGAVGSSCGDPQLAYEFLRQFLSEEFQFEVYRPRADKNGSVFANPADPQADGLIEKSWPVRTVGSAAMLWDNRRYQVEEVGGRGRWKGTDMKRKKEVLDTSLLITDEDIPALKWEIDDVCFPIIQTEGESLTDALALLNEDDGTPTDVDIDELAQEVYQNLWWHLAEG